MLARTNSACVEEAAARLLEAAALRVPCQPVRSLLSNSVAAAYDVQDLLVELSLMSGRRIVGRKVGLTSEVVQRQLGVAQPDFGYLFGDMEIECGNWAAIDHLLQPRIEAEIAFIMDADLDSDKEEDIINGFRAAIAAFEVVDSRIDRWDISLVDTVADNASCGLFVLGTENVPPESLDLVGVEMEMRNRAGDPVSSGRGSDCLGDPMRSAVWVARKALEFGRPLRAGDIVLSGALGPMVPVVRGDYYTAHLSGLGTVSVEF